MPRTTLNKTTLLGSYPALPLAANSADLTLTACTGSSGASGNQIAWGDAARLLVVVQNSHATNPFTVTFTSKVDPFNRTGDISAYSLSAGEVGVFLFERQGWMQVADSMLYCEGNSASILIGAVAV